MSTFNFTVDTNPMANEIGRVSKHVNATTSAVVAMQTAVVIAEKKAADHVCFNVNKGFFSLIRSQISQKIAKLQSDIDSHLMQLNQQKKQLLAIKDRMERDFNMISGRYLKLFNGLNSSLKERIYTLDKPTVDLADKEVGIITNRSKNLTATVPITQLESITDSQKIIASNLKYRSFILINSMKNFLAEFYHQNKLTNQILIENNTIVKDESLCIPILISESNNNSLNNKNLDIILNKSTLNKQSQSDIEDSLMSNIDSFQWKDETIKNKEVQNEFNNMVSTSNNSQRIKDLTNKLFKENNYQVITN